MKTHIYIFTDTNRELFHCGISNDIKRTIKFYTSIPMTVKNYKRYILVFLCEVFDMKDAIERQNKFQALPVDKKRATIEKSNPNYIEIKP